GFAVGAVLRSGERRLKSLTLPNEERVARSDQRGDQILLPRGWLQDRGVGQDRRESRFPPDQAFVCREDKGPVFLDRPAEGEAGLVALEGRVLLQRTGEDVAPVEPLVAEIVIDVSVKLICAAFRDDVDDAAGGPPELGVIAVSVDLEFGHRLLADGRADA